MYSAPGTFWFDSCIQDLQPILVKNLLTFKLKDNGHQITSKKSESVGKQSKNGTSILWQLLPINDPNDISNPPRINGWLCKTNPHSSYIPNPIKQTNIERNAMQILLSFVSISPQCTYFFAGERSEPLHGISMRAAQCKIMHFTLYNQWD